MNELGILPFPLPITIREIMPTIPIVSLLAMRNNAFGLAKMRSENIFKNFSCTFFLPIITLFWKNPFYIIRHIRRIL